MGRRPDSTDLRQYIDAIESGGDPHPLAIRLFDANDGTFAEGPAASAGAQTGRKHEDQFELCARLKCCLGIEEHTAGAEVSGRGRLLGVSFRSAILLTNLDRNLDFSALGSATFGAIVCGQGWSLLSVLGSQFSV